MQVFSVKQNLIFLFLNRNMGTQKNRLNETVLLSTKNIYQNWWVRKYLQFTIKDLLIKICDILVTFN